MTRFQAITATVDSKIRKDGGSLCGISIFWPKNGKGGVEYFEPRKAESMAREIRANGGVAIVGRV